MVTNIPLYSGVVRIIVVAAILGGITVGSLVGTDLLNFNTSKATARAMELEADVQTRRENINLENYKKIEDARTEAEVTRIAQETEAHQRELTQASVYQEKRHEQNLELDRWTRYVVWAATLIASVGLTIFLIQYGRSRVILSRAQVTNVDPWSDPEQRAMARRQARMNEIAERKAILRQQVVQETLTGGDGNRPPRSELIRPVGR